MFSTSHQPPGPNEDSELHSVYESQVALVRRPLPAALAVRQTMDAVDLGDGWSIVEVWRTLLQRKITWILFAFIGGVIGYLYTLPQTPIYQAYTSIEIVALNDNFMNLGRLTPNDTGAAAASDVQTQIKILQSASILRRVVEKLQHDVNSITLPPTRLAAWKHALHMSESTQGQSLAQLINQAAASMRAKATGQTRVVEITVDSPSPQLAALFLNTLSTEFIQHNLESRWKSTEKASDWLSHQLDDMRVKLERSEDALQQYARESGLVFTDEKKSVSEAKLMELQVELSKATAERINTQSRFELAQNSPPDTLPDILNDKALQSSQSAMVELRRQIADLSTLYTPAYTKVKRLQAELDTLQTAFQHDRASILGRIKAEYDEASRRETLLQDAYDKQVANVSGEGERSIQYNILKREADSNRMLYDAMLSQLKQSSIASAMRASNVSVVDPAVVPHEPYKPNAKSNAIIGMVAGLFLGAAFIVTQNRMDRTIQKPGEAPSYLKIPELGVIPSGKSEVARAKGPNASPLDKYDSRLERAPLHFNPSIIAEGFRATLVSMLFATRSASVSKVFVVTSGSPGEGKSTVASNLAMAMAEVGQRVLIIDADLRRPRQHAIFSVDNESGLSSVLLNKSNLNGDLSLGGTIRESDVPGLFVMPSGPGTVATTNLLYGPHFTALLKYVRKHFDVVLIDTPPMLQMADARVIAGLADATVIVIRAGRTTRDAAIATHRLFQQDGSHVLGTILNAWNPKTSPNGYYGYNNNYYAKSAYYSQNQN